MKKTKTLSLLLMLAIVFSLFANLPGNVAMADSYTKTFIISAYYSPLPCQNRYATGSYEADIRLNGRGTNGADGTQVYPGMVAAPYTYDYGTKMHIPGIGNVAVHDRGGAIVTAGERGNAYDRLDVWMGWGDEGLKRALNWGKRTVDVTIYGVDDSIEEQVDLGTFSYDESVPKCGSGGIANAPVVENKPAVIQESLQQTTIMGKEESLEDLAKEYGVELDLSFDSYLNLGDSGDLVKQLQQELKTMNYYRGPISGYYDEVTHHAVYKFQQSQGIVTEKAAYGAGVFGPKTQSKINDFISARNEAKVRIAQANDEVYIASEDSYLTLELDPGVKHQQVARLQEFLKNNGFYSYDYITDYFGPLTEEALVKFQIANNIVEDESALGAGRVGPKTLELINNLS